MIEVADGDVARQGLETGIDAGPAAVLHDGRGVGRHREAGQLGTARRVERVHVAVGVTEHDLQPAETRKVDERRLGLPAGREAVVGRRPGHPVAAGTGGAAPDAAREVRHPVRVAMHEDRASLFAGERLAGALVVRDAQAERHGVLLGRLQLLLVGEREGGSVNGGGDAREIQLAQLAVEGALPRAARERLEDRVDRLGAEGPLERPPVRAGGRAAGLGVTVDLDRRLCGRVVEREPLRRVEPADRSDVSEPQLLLEAARVDAPVSGLEIPPDLRRPGVRNLRIVRRVDVRRRGDQELHDLRPREG